MVLEYILLLLTVTGGWNGGGRRTITLLIQVALKLNLKN